MPSYEYELQTFCGSPIEPTRGLSHQNKTRLMAAKRVLDLNYYEIDQYIDGELATNPIYLCLQEQREDSGFEVLRLLHNYLASLYSFNETIRTLFNRHTPENICLSNGDFTPASGGTDVSYYGRKLSFLRGLRTDFQHGGFACLYFESVGELGEFAGYHIRFDKQAFINDSGLRSPTRFLGYTNESEQQHPICYIARFHTHILQKFYENIEEWFDIM